MFESAMAITMKPKPVPPWEPPGRYARVCIPEQEFAAANHQTMPLRYFKGLDSSGYWNIEVPSLNMSNVSRLITMIKGLSEEKLPVSCVYIDSKDGNARFDLRKRYDTSWRTLSWTIDDPDALIADPKTYGKKLRGEDLSKELIRFRGELVRNFAYKNIYAIVKKSRNEVLMTHNRDQDELRARGLLREMIGEDAYKRYLRCGFVTCNGTSGTTYVIRGGSGFIDCYRPDQSGKHVLVESICIQFMDKGLPFTDGVIMRRMLIENNEHALRKSGNIISRGGVHARLAS